MASKSYETPPPSPILDPAFNNQPVPPDAVRMVGIRKTAGENLVSPSPGRSGVLGVSEGAGDVAGGWGHVGHCGVLGTLGTWQVAGVMRGIAGCRGVAGCRGNCWVLGTLVALQGAGDIAGCWDIAGGTCGCWVGGMGRCAGDSGVELTQGHAP